MRYALLIDSENASFKFDKVMEEISKLGDTPIRLIFGDFTTKSALNWVDVCKKYAITCIQTMNFTLGKNSSDISLVIEGMKILYEKSYIDGIIIVSSDSDYTPLCREWRNMGKDVIGIGRNDTPESYRASCTKFIYSENLFGEMNKNNSLSIDKIKDYIESIINANNGKCQMSIIVESLLKAYPDFDSRSYGYKKSIEFFKNEFDNLEFSEDIKNTYFVSIKDSNNIKKEKIEKKEYKALAKKMPNNKKTPKKMPNNKKKKPTDKGVKIVVRREEVNDSLTF